MVHNIASNRILIGNLLLSLPVIFLLSDVS